MIFADKLDAFKVAVRVTAWVDGTVCVLMLDTVKTLSPAGTVTVDGNERYAADAAGAASATDTPSAGAGLDSVIVALVALPPSTAAGDTLNPESSQPEVMVSATVVLWLSAPLVPVIVITVVPAAAVSSAVKVRTEESVDDAGLNAAVTPVGRPLAE